MRTLHDDALRVSVCAHDAISLQESELESTREDLQTAKQNAEDAAANHKSAIEAASQVEGMPASWCWPW